MNILGIKANGHDTGAAIVATDENSFKVYAVSEARLNRCKHSFRFPLLSIDYCLHAAGLHSLDMVDLIVVDRHIGQSVSDSWKNVGLAPPDPSGDHFPLRQHFLLRSFLNGRTNYIFSSHLAAHAASTYCASPFDDAAILVMDGGFAIFSAQGLALKPIDQNGYSDNMVDGSHVNYGNLKSTGCFYEYVTMHLGFSGFDSGKTMALAAYPGPDESDLIRLPADRFSSTLMHYRATMDHLSANSVRFDPSMNGGPHGLLDEKWVALARNAQAVLESDALFLAREAARKAHSRKLALAGGVALSCVTNRKLIDSGEFDDVFIQPAASDEGIPLGCALLGYYSRGGTRRWRMQSAYLGKPNDRSELEKLLDYCGVEYSTASHALVAQYLADGCVIARVSGASEYGPRALGNRSILADPRRADMVERLNLRVKHRESFRPFAPACHHDKAKEYFDLPVEAPYMVIAANVKPHMQSKLPAITHVDGSCRPQTVRRDQNPDFFDLIDAFGQQTGIYCLVNTSFNDNGEPIVETYEDALISLSRMEIDYLYIEDLLIPKPRNEEFARALEVRRSERNKKKYASLFEKYCNKEHFETLLSHAPKLSNGVDSATVFRDVGFGPFR